MLIEKPELFSPIERELSLTKKVTEELEQMLLENRLLPGEKLPPERELARQFNVSRTVIREAVKTLAAKGMLEVKMGSGTIVSRPDLNTASQSIKMFLLGDNLDVDFRKLIEVRRLLEVEIAGLAAERRSRDDIEKMDKILQLAELNKNDREKFAALDVEFHAALASATKNELFELILNALSEVMIMLRIMAFEVENMAERAMNLHLEVYGKVKEGDVVGAKKAMQSHLIESEQTMYGILKKGQVGFIGSEND